MRKQKGSIIVFALIVLSFILIAAFSVAAVTLVERRSANVSVNSTTAFQNSDKGMEEFLQQIYKDLDQNSSLADLATALNTIYGTSDYDCQSSGDTNVPARIGSDGSGGEVETEFIITAFGEATLLHEESSGWDWAGGELIPLDECTDQLADVARFKVAGNYNNASRAVFVKLRDSLTRGLVARWSFEDRAQIARIVEDEDDRNSFIAQDSSKQNHTMTLCPLRVDTGDSDQYPIDVDIDIGGDESITHEIVTFSDCGSDAANGMSPYKRDESSDDEGEERPAGAWTDGIVEEDVSGGAVTVVGSDSKNEAIYFTDSTFLAMYVDDPPGDPCVDEEINCVEKDVEDDLQLSDGFSVSMWIKVEDDGGIQNLLTRRAGNSSGYDLYLNDGVIYFKVGNREIDTDVDVIDDEWHHVAARWDRNSGNMAIWVDADSRATGTFTGGIGEPDVTMYVGADQNGSPTMNNGTVMDDLWVWDRSLTNTEIWRLCTEAESNDGVNHDNGDHPAGCPQDPPTT